MVQQATSNNRDGLQLLSRLLLCSEKIKGLPPCSRLSMVLWQCRPHLSSQSIHALDATTSISSNVSWHQQLHTEILFTPEQFSSGTTLTKNLPKRLPSTASRVDCISLPSPFVDVIPHIGSLSTMFQIQFQIYVVGNLAKPGMLRPPGVLFTSASRDTENEKSNRIRNKK